MTGSRGTGGGSDEVAFDDGDVGDRWLRPDVSSGRGRSLVCGTTTSDDLSVTSVLSLIRGTEDPEVGWLV